MPLYKRQLLIQTDGSQRLTTKCPKCNTRLQRCWDPAPNVTAVEVCPSCIPTFPVPPPSKLNPLPKTEPKRNLMPTPEQQASAEEAGASARRNLTGRQVPDHFLKEGLDEQWFFGYDNPERYD